MAISAGNLDSLIGMTLPDADYTGITTQSGTSTPNGTALGSGTVTSVTVTTTGTPGAGTNADNTLKIVGVNDTINSISLGLFVPDQPVAAATENFFVIGYNPQGILLAANDQSVVATVFLNNNNFPLLDSEAGVLSFTPIPASTKLTFTSNGSFGGTAPITPVAPPTPTPPAAFSVTDTTTKLPVLAAETAYTGPVAGITSQYINVTTDSLNITATPNSFIHSGSGNDALVATSGTNVLDGGTGSNFLTCGSSNTDQCFVDTRGATSDIWSTINNFHQGDTATVFGISQSSFNLAFVDNQGAAGFTGLTLHATAAGKPEASMTLVGFTTADMTNGRLGISFGVDAASGSNYMLVQELK